MEDVLAAQRRYFDSGATRPLRFRREMLTRLELAPHPVGGELLEALKADLNKSPYEGYMSELGPTLAELRFARGHLKSGPGPSGTPPPVPVPLRGHGVPGALRRVADPRPVELPPVSHPGPPGVRHRGGVHRGGEAGEDAPASARALAEVLGRVFPPEYITVAEGDGRRRRPWWTSPST